MTRLNGSAGEVGTGRYATFHTHRRDDVSIQTESPTTAITTSNGTVRCGSNGRPTVKNCLNGSVCSQIYDRGGSKSFKMKRQGTMAGLGQFILKTSSTAFRKAAAKGGAKEMATKVSWVLMRSDDRPRGHAQARGRDSIPSWPRFRCWRTVRRGRMLHHIAEDDD
jgi:hypothetical protein